MQLVLCPDCQRHVRDDAAACPFCGSSHASHASPGSPVRVARLGRAAIMAFGVAASAASLGACAKEPDNIAQPYGAPPNPTPTPTVSETAPPVVDAAPAPTETTPKKDAGVATVPTTTATVDLRNLKKPYGAPPIPVDYV